MKNFLFEYFGIMTAVLSVSCIGYESKKRGRATLYSKFLRVLGHTSLTMCLIYYLYRAISAVIPSDWSAFGHLNYYADHFGMITGIFGFVVWQLTKTPDGLPSDKKTIRFFRVIAKISLAACITYLGLNYIIIPMLDFDLAFFVLASLALAAAVFASVFLWGLVVTLGDNSGSSWEYQTKRRFRFLKWSAFFYMIVLSVYLLRSFN